MEQLEQEDLLPGGHEQRGYGFTAAASGGQRFTITGTPIDASKTDWPTLEIDENVQVTER